MLFVCTGNSARSPIAEALLRHHTGGRVTVTSAGSYPKRSLHPNAVRVLREASTSSSTTWTPSWFRLRSAGLSFRSDVVAGPGGRQILLADPDGNLIELFQPAHRPDAPTPATP